MPKSSTKKPKKREAEEQEDSEDIETWSPHSEEDDDEEFVPLTKKPRSGRSKKAPTSNRSKSDDDSDEDVEILMVETPKVTKRNTKKEFSTAKSTPTKKSSEKTARKKSSVSNNRATATTKTNPEKKDFLSSGASSSSKKKKEYELADDADVVLAKCRSMQRSPVKNVGRTPTSSSGRGIRRTVADLVENHEGNASKLFKNSTTNEFDIGDDEKNTRVIVEVKEMDCDAVMDGLEDVAMEVANSILAQKGFRLEVPSRAASNQIYVKELDRIVLGEKVGSRSFLNVKESRKAAITTRVMQLLHEVLRKGIHITKRDLFYTDVKLFVEQTESDGVLDDVATIIGCTRSNLHVVASDKGLVVGRISFYEDGDFIDCTRMGVGGKAIPPYIDKITDIRSDATFVLLVEKEAAYMRMAEDRFYQRYPCIVITAKGQPDVATRMFLSRLTSELGLPVLGLVDADPYGLKILSVYVSGSKNMSYDSASLTTPNVKWLGLRPSDLDRYNLPEQCRLDMTENDIKCGKEMLQEEFIQKNPEWMAELEIMVKTKKKAEIQALSSFGFQYITEEYLPRKLKEGDWI